jgi:transposase
VGVSRERGVDLVMNFDKSNNMVKFKVYLEELRTKYFFEDICIYMDSLRVHTGKAVQERLEELSIPCIFAPTYSPDYSGIESVFSIFKNKIKRLRLRALVQDYKINLKEEILKEF